MRKPPHEREDSPHRCAGIGRGEVATQPGIEEPLDALFVDVVAPEAPGQAKCSSGPARPDLTFDVERAFTQRERNQETVRVRQLEVSQGHAEILRGRLGGDDEQQTTDRPQYGAGPA